MGARQDNTRRKLIRSMVQSIPEQGLVYVARDIAVGRGLAQYTISEGGNIDWDLDLDGAVDRILTIIKQREEQAA
jgi:hypothetical protein